MDKITELNHIDTTTKEGKYLLAALSVITTECRRDKTPFQVLRELTALQGKIYGPDVQTIMPPY
jgi:hypothetical protein